MEARLKIFSIAVSLALLLFIFELVRSRRLKEQYSLLWLATGAVLLVFSLSKELMDRLSHLVGIYYSPSAFFLLAFLFLMVITVQFSVVLSRLTERNRALTQEVAVLRLKVERMERDRPRDEKPPPP